MLETWSEKQNLFRKAASIPKVFYSGRVSRVVGLTVEGFLPQVPVRGLCRIHRHGTGDSIEAEVIGLKNDTVVLMPIGETAGIQVGDRIETLKSEASIKVGNSLLGRVLDGSGHPIAGDALENCVDYPLYQSPMDAVTRKKISKSLSLGVRAFDGFLNCAMGQRIAIMAGSGVGKSTLLGMIARNTEAEVNVIGLIGERGREVREFLENDLGPEGLARSVVVVATSDAPALVRMRAAFVTTAIAEYFRDQGKNVLLMMDSLTRFAMASREVGLSLGEPPTTKGYTPSLFSVLPRLLERAGTTAGNGSITGLYTILAEGDDMQDPIADAVRAIVDGHVVLSRKLAQSGHYPAIDILQSISRVMSNVVTPQHNEVATKLRRAMALYSEMEDYINIGVYTAGKNAELDQAIAKIEGIRGFLRQKVNEKTSLAETVSRMVKLTMD